MFNHLKQCTSLALCTLLFNLALCLPAHMMAMEKIPAPDNTTQSITTTTAHNEQSNALFLADLNESLLSDVQSAIALARINEFLITSKEVSIDSDDADILMAAKEKKTSGQLLHTDQKWFEKHQGQATNIKVCGDKGKIFAWYSYGMYLVDVWSIHTKEFLYRLSGPHEHTGRITAIEISGDKIITGSFDGTAKVWDINTGEYLYTLVKNNEKHYIISAIATNGDKVVTASHNHAIYHGLGDRLHRSPARIQVWNVNTGKLLYTLTNYVNHIHFIAFNDNKIITETYNLIFKVWPLSIDLHAPELTPLAAIYHTLTILQADFIARTLKATQAGQNSIIALPNDFNNADENETQEQTDGRTYFTFPDKVRAYLLTRLFIRK